jgi:acetyl-CoA synthetase
MSVSEYRAALGFLEQHRTDYKTALKGFSWPRPSHFNWALDHFRPLALELADQPALLGEHLRISYDELEARSNQVSHYLASKGVRRGDAVLLMLSNIPELWITVLAVMKLGAVLVPTSTQMTPADLKDRLERGEITCAVVEAGETAKFAQRSGFTRISVGAAEGWDDLEQSQGFPAEFQPETATKADDLLLLYFTSGTTSKPKLVQHTHQSYPIGHLSTIYVLGLKRGDAHWNISSPGWAKHMYSCFFAPLSVGATVVVDNERFDPIRVLRLLNTLEITTFCAPPTVWRMLIQQDLKAYPNALREALSAGEPLNPEVMAAVERAWNLDVRDFYGQTESTAQIGNPPGQPLRPGSMGRPLPGFHIALIDADGNQADEGEISIDLSRPPVGLMVGYKGEPEKSKALLGGPYYPTGDVARRDAEGYLWYVGRADDVFKSSGYRISPFELESLLIEHPAIAEAAVVPAPHPKRSVVPKAYVVLAGGHAPSREMALEVFRFIQERMAPYQRIRRLEFSELPKTISGKIRRVELKGKAAQAGQGEFDFAEEDFEELGR